MCGVDVFSTINACSYCQDAHIASCRPTRSGGISCANWKLDHDTAWDPCANWNVSAAYSCKDMKEIGCVLKIEIGSFRRTSL